MIADWSLEHFYAERTKWAALRRPLKWNPLADPGSEEARQTTNLARKSVLVKGHVPLLHHYLGSKNGETLMPDMSILGKSIVRRLMRRTPCGAVKSPRGWKSDNHWLLRLI